MKAKVGDMKVEAATFVKHLWTVISSLLKEKSGTLKGKADVMKTKLLVLGMMKNRNIFGAISNKFNSLLNVPHGRRWEWIPARKSKNGRQHDNVMVEISNNCEAAHADLEFLSHDIKLFDSDTDNIQSTSASPRNSPCVSTPSHRTRTPDIICESEIDNIAGAFIKRFHNQMRLQKQQSYKTYQAMLARSV